jgi:hypothetical protein
MGAAAGVREGFVRAPENCVSRSLGRPAAPRRGSRHADDFLRRITFDALSAGLPIRDDPLRGEHEDRVVGDALDEKPKLLLAFA